MKIAIIGTGNVGGALATKWANAGHEIFLGVKDTRNFKGQKLLVNPATSVHSILEAVHAATVVVIATPAQVAIEVAKSLGDTNGKIIIDTMNIIKGNGPSGFNNTSDAILANTQSKELVKCFNTTGYNNMEDAQYGETTLDIFMAGDSILAKTTAKQLAKDIGFADCYDVGGNDKFQLMEQFAWFWINLAIFQNQGREIGFKLLKR
ncbi:MAG: NAD(P)-binding domain-containing protein [Bacteroidota bacterium]